MELEEIKGKGQVLLRKSGMTKTADKQSDYRNRDMRLQLKDIFYLFQKSPLSEEKTPIIQKDELFSGDIMKEFHDTEKGDATTYGSRRLTEERSTTESDNESEKKSKMSVPRKFCFLLSLNAGVIYVAAFLWLIPCRHPFCPKEQYEWTVNMSGSLTSNMEPVTYSGLAPSIVFGYSDESGNKLLSLNISDGSHRWNRSMNSPARYVFCNFEVLRHINSSRTHVCFVTGYNYIGKFSVAHGSMFWQRNITNPDGETISKVSLTEISKRLYVLGISDSQLFVLNARDGTSISTTRLPCSWTIDVKLEGPWNTSNGSIWTLICEYGGSIEVYSFEERHLLPSKNNASQVEFSLLFSQESIVGSIDLAGDVAKTPNGLVLSWADTVCMITASSEPPFQKTWETRFQDSKGDPLPITNVLLGNFTDSLEDQVAITLQDDMNTTLVIVTASNGTTVMRTNLVKRSIMHMERIPDPNDKRDVIVLESIHNLDPSTNITTQNHERTYFMIQYNENEVDYENIITTNVDDSILIQHMNGAATLLISNRTPEGGTTIQRLVITMLSKDALCHFKTSSKISTI